MADPTNEELISIWAKAVDTQMHFNEMSVKSRQLGLTFVTAALALAVVLITQSRDFAINFSTQWGEFKLHLAVLLVAAAAFGLGAVRTLDLSVYHRMLRGAVAFGEDFEEHYMKSLFALDKGMTQAISLYSRYADAGYEDTSGKRLYNGTVKFTAEQKLRKFYRGAMWSLAISAILILGITNFGTISNLNRTGTQAVGSQSEAAGG